MSEESFLAQTSPGKKSAPAAEVVDRSAFGDRATYPRPDMLRANWLSLDGPWEFAFDPRDVGWQKGWFDQPLEASARVPFCIESEASGVDRTKAAPIFWYGKKFLRRELPAGERFFVQFGAVDHETDVWLNGKHLGRHVGGYTPFVFEITGHLQEENRLSLRVSDPLNKKALRGKQYIKKELSEIFYEPVSGIWQPVFVYATGATAIGDLRVSSNDRQITVRATNDRPDAARWSVTVVDPGGRTIRRESREGGKLDETWTFDGVALWSPDAPTLYDVVVALEDADGRVHDRVVVPVGFRRFAVENQKILLNDAPIFLRMVLVQGYYPGGHYTPEQARDYEREVLTYKSMGFNGIRVHEKIEDPRFLYYCDKHGLLVWEEMPSPYLFAIVDEKQYEKELDEVLARDVHHPSVMAFVLFNETWGIYDVLWSERRREFIRRMYRKVKAHDAGKLVVDNSGFDHVITDVVDIHHYLSDVSKIREYYGIFGDRKKMATWFRHVFHSAFYLVKPHLSRKNPYVDIDGYRGFEPFLVSEFGGAGYYEGKWSMLESFEKNVDIMREFEAIQGYCLTQAYDVENERNGLMTFRRELKEPLDEIRRINEK